MLWGRELPGRRAIGAPHLQEGREGQAHKAPHLLGVQSLCDPGAEDRIPHAKPSEVEDLKDKI